MPGKSLYQEYVDIVTTYKRKYRSGNGKTVSQEELLDQLKISVNSQDGLNINKYFLPQMIRGEPFMENILVPWKHVLDNRSNAKSIGNYYRNVGIYFQNLIDEKYNLALNVFQEYANNEGIENIIEKEKLTREDVLNLPKPGQKQLKIKAIDYKKDIREISRNNLKVVEKKIESVDPYIEQIIAKGNGDLVDLVFGDEEFF